jgi:uncharacterized protein (TIGR02598 family)
MSPSKRRYAIAFSLVEVVLAMGIVSFAVLATVALLSVADDTSKRSRDETFAAQIAANEFERLRALSNTGFPTANYVRYYDLNLAEVATATTPGAAYELHVSIDTPPPPEPADRVINAEVRYPVNVTNQSKLLYCTLMNVPAP